MQSAILIVPEAHRAAANVFAGSMGWGADNYSVAMSASGKSPVTHWGCRADVSEGFIALLEAPPPEAEPILAVVEIDIQDSSDPRSHFMAVAGRLGLKIIEEVGE